jgi:hypothetical protein
MASVTYWSGNWASSGPSEDLAPGDFHPWTATGFVSGDAISITAYSVKGETRDLAVENMQMEWNGDQQLWILNFNIRNVGSNFVDGYFFGFAHIGP